MSKYWPTAALLRRPELRPEQKKEIQMLSSANVPMSMDTMHTCGDLVHALPACTSLTVICSEDSQFRRVYLDYPTVDEFTALERGGFMCVLGGNFGFVTDALH